MALGFLLETAPTGVRFSCLYCLPSVADYLPGGRFRVVCLAAVSLGTSHPKIGRVHGASGRRTDPSKGLQFERKETNTFDFTWNQ
jgi:hypothetical protein